MEKTAKIIQLESLFVLFTMKAQEIELDDMSLKNYDLNPGIKLENFKKII